MRKPQTNRPAYKPHAGFGTGGITRPLLTQKTKTGLLKMIDHMPATAVLGDAEIRRSMEWIRKYLEWHNSARQVAKREALRAYKAKYDRQKRENGDA